MPSVTRWKSILIHLVRERSSLFLSFPFWPDQTADNATADGTDSIRSAARTVAANLMSYYHGDEPGQTPGILPGPPPAGPYYWWQAGAMFGTLIDYWYYTGDSTYNDETRFALVFQAEAPGNSYMPANWTLSLGNDDQAFWGMAAMLAAEVNFPNPPEDQPQYLALAQAVFNTQAARWERENCNGGLRWQIPHTNGGYNYKNTIANVCFLNIASRLARYTNNDSYAEWAERTWDWVEGVGYITEDYNVLDGGHTEANCTDINPVQFSANAAVLIHGTAIMYSYVRFFFLFISLSLGPPSPKRKKSNIVHLGLSNTPISINPDQR